MIEIVSLASGSLCLIASIGTFSSSFFVSNKEDFACAKSGFLRGALPFGTEHVFRRKTRRDALHPDPSQRGRSPLPLWLCSRQKTSAEQAKKLKTISLVLFVVSIILFAVYFYLMRDTKLARKLLDALQTGNPEALQTCDTYVSHKDPKIYDQFKQFTKNVKKNHKLSPEEAQYQVLNFCKTTAMSDLGLK
jgi:hypothetical protein